MQNLKRNNFFFSLIFISILILSFCIRIYKIDQLSLWRDEAFSVLLAQESIVKIITTLSRDSTPPLYELFLHVWIQLFGDSEFSVRLPSVLFSIGTLIFFYRLARNWFDRKNSLLILTLLSVHMVSIFFARESRMYSLLLFLVTAQLHYFQQNIKHSNIRHAVLFVLFSVLALYTHHLSALVIICESIYLFLLQRKNNIQSWKIPIGSVCILAIPWLILLYNQMTFSHDVWLSFHPLYAMRDTFRDLSTGLSLFSTNPLAAKDYILIFLTTVLIGIGTLEKKARLYTILFWGILTFMYLISFVRPLLYIRYISFLLPFFILIEYQAIAKIFSSFSLRILVVCLLLILHQRLYIMYLNAYDSKPPYRDVAEFLHKNVDDDSIVVHTDAITYFPLKYYAKETLPFTIFDPYIETPSYVGTSYIQKEAYSHNITELDTYDTLWTLELKPIGKSYSFEPNYALYDTISFESQLILKKWNRTNE